MPVLRTSFRSIFIVLTLFLTACGAMLPHGETVTDGPWQNFQEAQQTFDKIILHQTTVQDLKKLQLDPATNPNITILNYSDVLRLFIPSPTINADNLDAGVQECIAAKTACQGYSIDQHSIKRKRYGNFWADFLNFKRKVDVVGWRFSGVILIKDNVVVYKLSGGQPAIHELEENMNPLGPFQGIGSSGLINR